jgi:hypothetical protein
MCLVCGVSKNFLGPLKTQGRFLKNVISRVTGPNLELFINITSRYFYPGEKVCQVLLQPVDLIGPDL